MEKKISQSEQVLDLNGVIYRELRILHSEVIQDGPDSGKEEYQGPSPQSEIIGDFIPQEMKTQEGKVVYKAIRK